MLILGPNSITNEYNDYCFYRFSIDRSLVINLNKKLSELKINLRYSLGLNEEKKKRDLKYLQEKYINVIVEFVSELLKPKSNYNHLFS